MDKRVGNGVKLMAKLFPVIDPDTGEALEDEHGNELLVPFKHKVNVEVSRVSAKAKALIEANGGTVTRVHYNRLGIRALLKPEKFPNGLPKPARTPIYLRDKVDREGTLPAPGPPPPPPSTASSSSSAQQSVATASA